MLFLLTIMNVTVSILVRNRAGELKDVTSHFLTGFSKSLSVLVRENSLAFLTAGFGTLKSEHLELRFRKRLSRGCC